MSHLIIVHQAFQDSKVEGVTEDHFVPSNSLKWETCRRKIYFYFGIETYSPKTNNSTHASSNGNQAQFFQETEAEEFLVKVLCGLESPLIGETEVFGQFKMWWQNLPQSEIKKALQPRIESIFSTVKKIREVALCGLGSQSYGSLLRKKLSQISNIHELNIDFIGAGQLVQEMLPWVAKSKSVRLIVRDPSKYQNLKWPSSQISIVKPEEVASIAQILVVAAPLDHAELESFLLHKVGSKKIRLYDFRHNSMAFDTTLDLEEQVHLDHFTTEVNGNKNFLSTKVSEAQLMIANWKAERNSKAQIRPFGWDDL